MARGRTTNRAVADAQREIDVRQLAKAGQLEPGNVQLLQWRRNGEITARVTIQAYEGHLTMHLGGIRGQAIHVPLLASYPHLGGKRVWFQCPYCIRRVAILYVRKAIACRHCHNLRYRVEAETDGDKAFRRAGKLRARLGWVPGVAFGEGPKPKGMRQATFDKLVTKYRAAEMQTLVASMAWLEQARAKLARIEL